MLFRSPLFRVLLLILPMLLISSVPGQFCIVPFSLLLLFNFSLLSLQSVIFSMYSSYRSVHDLLWLLFWLWCLFSRWSWFRDIFNWCRCWRRSGFRCFSLWLNSVIVVVNSFVLVIFSYFCTIEELSPSIRIVDEAKGGKQENSFCYSWFHLQMNKL